MDTYTSDLDLLARYVAVWEKMGDLWRLEVPEELRITTNAHALQQWRPMRFNTDVSALEALYHGLGLPGQGSTRFPPLYETLILSYRWVMVDLGTYRLLGNEPAGDLAPLLANMRRDEGLRSTLLPNSYIQFGMGTDVDYDPVCFDFRHRQRNGDCRIVKLDHEEIFCRNRIRETAELAPNFRSLVLDTLKRAAAQPS